MKFKDGDRVRHIPKGYTGTSTGKTLPHNGLLWYEVHWDSPVKGIDANTGERAVKSLAHSAEHDLELMNQPKGGSWEDIWGEGAT